MADGDRVSGWYRQYGRELVGYAANEIGNWDTAEELVQDVFAKCVEHASTIRHPRGWLYRATHNKLVDLKRRASHNRVFSASDTLDTHYTRDEPDLTDRVAEHDHLTHTLNQLTAADKTLLLRFADNQRNVKTTADQYGTTRNTIKVRLYRARQRLMRLADRG